MGNGCLYWLFIGFWLEPMIIIAKIIYYIFYFIICAIIWAIKGMISGGETKRKDVDSFEDLYDTEDLYDIKDEIKEQILDEIEYDMNYTMHNKDIICESYNNNQCTKIKKEEKETMYDKEKGIYPPGEYLVGEDIGVGKYLLTCVSDFAQVSVYENYKKFKEDEMIPYHSFEKDYHLSLREEGLFVVIEGAEIKRL